MPKKLYVGNLSYETTEAALADIFGEVGEVTSVSLITDRMTGRSKGFAFVEMAEDSAAQQAISQLNGKDIGGRTIKVEEARPRRPRRDRWESPRYWSQPTSQNIQPHGSSAGRAVFCPGRDSASHYGTEAENGLPSRWQRICTTCRPE